MAKWIAASVLLLLAGSVLAADADIANYAAHSQTQRRVRLKSLYAKRADLLKPPAKGRKSRENGPADKQSKDIRAERLNAINKQIERLENPLEPYYAKDKGFLSAELGDIVWHDAEMQDAVGNESLSVFQVSDRANCIIRVTYRYQSASRGPPGEVTGELWLSGVPTDTFSDGDSFKVSGAYFFIGTKQYETVSGAPRTLKEITPIDLTDHADEFTRKSEAREWTSVGGHKATAILVHAEGGKVELMNLDGKLKSVKLADLSDDDKAYIKEYNARLMPKASKP